MGRTIVLVTANVPEIVVVIDGQAVVDGSPVVGRRLSGVGTGRIGGIARFVEGAQGRGMASKRLWGKRDPPS